MLPGVASKRPFATLMVRKSAQRSYPPKHQLLATYPDLAQRPAQFAMALETLEEYLKDLSGGKQMGKGYADRAGGTR